MNSSSRESVSFKGTRQGILMSIAEDETLGNALENLRDKFEANRTFFAGAPISLDLGWRELDTVELQNLLKFFSERELNLLGIISTSLNTRRLCENSGLKVIIGRLGLADHHGNRRQVARRKDDQCSSAGTSGVNHETELQKERREAEESATAETIIIRRTIRTGQRVAHPGNVVIMGDVNPGAEVEAEGDLIVLGALRGDATAGIGEDREESSIIALKFQPSSIRIGDQVVCKIDGKLGRNGHPVIARLKNGKIEFFLYA